jgi:putative tricarboxylic transport membrane protein
MRRTPGITNGAVEPLRQEQGAVVRIRDPKNFLSGLLFTGLAILLAYNALLLPLGTASRMGPGYFPFLLAVVLGGLGLVVIVNSLRFDGEGLSRFEWRGLALVILSIVAFGATIDRFGFIPAVGISAALSLLAGAQQRPLTAIALIAFLLAFCWAVFVWGLGLPVRLFG